MKLKRITQAQYESNMEFLAGLLELAELEQDPIERARQVEKIQFDIDETERRYRPHKQRVH